MLLHILAFQKGPVKTEGDVLLFLLERRDLTLGSDVTLDHCCRNFRLHQPGFLFLSLQQLLLKVCPD